MSTAFLFPGQGSQFVGMGRDLCASRGTACALLRKAAAICNLPLEEAALRGPFELLSRTDVLQPALTAVSIGCLEALEERELFPDAVAGHSLGEFAALRAAGVIDTQAALWLVCERGRLMQASAAHTHGAMTAVIGATPEQVEEAVAGVARAFRVGIANYNSPAQIVVSGEVKGIEAVEARLACVGRLSRLRVSGAWHSPLMQEAAALFALRLSEVPLREPAVALYLGVSGARARTAEEIRSALAVQMVNPVRWSSVLRALWDDGASRFVEVGPGKVLRGTLRQNFPGEAAYSIDCVDGPTAIAACLSRRAA